MEENLNAEQIINSVSPADNVIKQELNREDMFSESFTETDTDSNYSDIVDDNSKNYVDENDNPGEEEEYALGEDEELFKENPLKALWVIAQEIKEMLYDLEDKLNEN